MPIENLFTAQIGSHIWGMDTKESDIDLFRVYVASTKDILRGTADLRSQSIEKEDTDIALHEAGKVVEMLIKGNVNFLIGVMSPIVVRTGVYHRALKEIVQRNISKNCYYSINGMARHNYKKYVERGLDRSERRCAKIVRVLNFGANLLKRGEFVFEPCYVASPKDIVKGLEELEEAYNASNLPEKPDENEFRDWLYEVRLHEWTKNK